VERPVDSRRVGTVTVAVFFALSRVAYFVAGVRFDAHPLDFFIQYPDPVLLRTDLLRTSYYFHMTPPLYNLFLGAVLKIFGDNYLVALQAVYLLAGLLLAMSLYLLMRSLGASQLASLLLTAVFVASPATVLYENWLYPDYLIAALLPFMAWLLGRAVARRSTPAMVGFFALAAVIVLSRSFYHLGWLLLIVALFLLMNRGWRSSILVGAAVPILLCVLLYVKNEAVFGFFSGSSTYGVQAYYGTTLQLTPAELYLFRQQGKISELSVDADAWYAQHPGIFNPRTGVPALDQVTKSTGFINWNNRGYLEVWNQYGRDATATVKARPTVVLRSLRMGLLVIFVPSDSYDFSPVNRARLNGLERVVDVGLYGQAGYVARANQDPANFRGAQLGERLREVGWFVVLAYVIALASGASMLWRLLRQRSISELAPMVAFTLLTISYIVVVDVPFGSPDNNRYRFMADPLVLALVSVAATAIVGRVRRSVTGRAQRAAAE
jgi:hypothetical protein